MSNKTYKEVTGFNTPEEFSAYELGKETESKNIVKYITEWKFDRKSDLGVLLMEKCQEYFNKHISGPKNGW